ncbi:MAG: conjugal transfer protein TraN, partial [Pseudomonadota bacterium]|nr:conjugal transfer protein TraN [Pseudomonadota bacterium]
YCAKKVLHTCVLKKESYCCYKSPLSRIIMEQVRPQLGGFGSKKHPNCGGLTLQELADVNWDVIDLSEWTVRLSDAGLLPTTPDELDQMWTPENTSKFELAYGSAEIPGPDGQIDKAQELSDRDYDSDRVSDMRNTLADSPTCYSDYNYQPWYGNQTIESAEVLVDQGGVGHIGSCGEGCIDIYIGSTVRNSLGPDECTHIYEQPYDIEVLRPDLIESATVEGFAWNDHIELLINGNLIYRGPDPNVFPPELPGTCQLGTDWCMGDSGGAYCSSTIPYPSPFDVTSNFAVQGIVHTMTRVAVGGTGLGFARIQVRYNHIRDTSGISSGCFEPAPH